MANCMDARQDYEVFWADWRLCLDLLGSESHLLTLNPTLVSATSLTLKALTLDPKPQTLNFEGAQDDQFPGAEWHKHTQRTH